MLTAIILSMSIMILMMSYIVYELIVTKKDIIEDITTAQDGVYELESNSYHSESDIKDWIQDENSNLQYDVDDHGTSISNLESDCVNNDDLDELKRWITEGEDKIIVMVKEINQQLDELVSFNDFKLSDKEPEEKEIIEQHTIDDILYVVVKTARHTKRDNGEFKIRETDEKTIKLTNKVKEDVTEVLKHYSDTDDFPSFLVNTYKGDKDEMGSKAPAKKAARKI